MRVMARTSIWILTGVLALSVSTNTLHADSQYVSSTLVGKKLRYVIGTENPGNGRDGEIVEVGYDLSKPLPVGITIAYCNLFNEKYSEQSKQQRAEYGPYLKSSDTAAEYGEGQIDPRGPGWRRNLTEQFGRTNITRAQAEKLLEGYFARVEQAIYWTENNPLGRRS
jgi:hypothetical protein